MLEASTRFDELNSRPNRTAVVSLTSTLSSTFINELTVSGSSDGYGVITNDPACGARCQRRTYGVSYPFLFPADGKLDPEKLPSLTVTGLSGLDMGPYPGLLVGLHLRRAQQHDQSGEQPHGEVGIHRRAIRVKTIRFRGRPRPHLRPTIRTEPSASSIPDIPRPRVCQSPTCCSETSTIIPSSAPSRTPPSSPRCSTRSCRTAGKRRRTSRWKPGCATRAGRRGAAS